MEKKERLIVILIIVLLVLETTILSLIYEIQLNKQIEYCNEMSIKIGKTCSNILGMWCGLNETKRDDIKFRLDNRLEEIEERFLNN